MAELSRTRALLYLHLSVLLWGFTGVLGALINLQTTSLVWWRMAFTVPSLFLIPGAIAQAKAMDRKVRIQVFAIGLIVAAHWLCFYGSIKVSGPSLALICLSCASIFTSFLEPLFNGTKFKPLRFFLGLAIIPGVYLALSGAKFDPLGVVLGITASAGAAIFSSLNKRFVNSHGPIGITVWQLSGAWFGVSIALLISATLPGFTMPIPSGESWIWIIFLAWACTTLPYLLSLTSMQRLSAFTTTLSVNLEPVYGIALAAWLLHEYTLLSPRFYLGSLLIMSVVAMQAWLSRKGEG